MIIWSGLGFLVVLIGFACALLVSLIVGAVTQDSHYWEAHGWTKLLGMWLAAGLVWPLGRWLNGLHRQRTLIDPQTGQTFVLNPRSHALFFIPVEYWTPIFLLLGLILLFV
jgi:hypothetical protein